jgi:hypothetical protein
MSDEKKRTYQAEVLGLPPLQMVLVHHDKNRAGQVNKSTQASLQKKDHEKPPEDLVQRIIEHLEKNR